MPLSTIASITYNADGSIADVDARLVGDRAELIAGAIKQLSILLPDDDADAVAVRAAADVDSLLSTAELTGIAIPEGSRIHRFTEKGTLEMVVSGDADPGLIRNPSSES